MPLASSRALSNRKTPIGVESDCESSSQSLCPFCSVSGTRCVEIQNANQAFFLRNPNEAQFALQVKSCPGYHSGMQPPQTKAPEMAWRGLHTVIQPRTSLLMCFASSYKLLGNEEMLLSQLHSGDKRTAESALCMLVRLRISVSGADFGFPQWGHC